MSCAYVRCLRIVSIPLGVLLWVGAVSLPALAKMPIKQVAARKAATKEKSSNSQETTEKAASTWPDFCTEWMGKLAVRERDNIANIHWETAADGVKGVYVGYSKDHTCTLHEGTEKVPVGKIGYLEVSYEKRGATIAEAQQSDPRPTTSYEVTEIFEYIKGKWDY
jgi:hypothetical protein